MRNLLVQLMTWKRSKTLSFGVWIDMVLSNSSSVRDDLFKPTQTRKATGPYRLGGRHNVGRNRAYNASPSIHKRSVTHTIVPACLQKAGV